MISKEKTIWIREYSKTGEFTRKGAYAIRKYHPTGLSNRECYAISVSPNRKSWYKQFFCFYSAAKFARNLIKRRNG